jgi:TP53 regulating kinase-like protein
MVDAAAGALGLEWIEGKSVRHLLPGGASEEEQVDDAHSPLADDDTVNVDALKEYGVSLGKHSLLEGLSFHFD